MLTRAAVLSDVPGRWDVREVELDAPEDGEVLVRVAASGLCHSDDHFATGDIPVGHLPLCGGHEGSGIVEEVGPGVRELRPGDHIVTSFIPSCGRCRWCATGRQNLCDNGARMLTGTQLDGTFRMHSGGSDVGQAGGVSTFSEWSVMSQWSCIKIPPDVPLEVAALLGCGVPTGWGSAVNAAGIEPGDVVLVIGVGGIGINAVQGARYAGAKNVVAIDPLENKREKAMELGATHAFATAEEAQEAITQMTRGQGADSAILTVDLMTAEVVGAGFNAVGKDGIVVLTGLNKLLEPTIQLPGTILTLFRKTVKGSLFGDCNPTTDIPKILGLYQAGDLKLDEIITRTYTLDQVNEGYEDLLAGKNVRGVVVHEH